ncbi:MAG TPA: hypothetical protein VGZ00_08475 [Candidatus Baltobacteraceae bacterium]|jgi:hypothetical protein|nr:hypothetical protein [Candidatus Baltobacteraceae bacterium]
MHKPSTSQNPIKVAGAIVFISVFQPHGSVGQTLVPPYKSSANSLLPALLADANETRTNYSTIGDPRNGMMNGHIIRIDGVVAHPAFPEAAPSHQGAARPGFFRRLLPKSHSASLHEMPPALQIFFANGDSLIVSPGTPLLPAGSQQIHLGPPDGRLHYTELQPIQDWTWARGFRIAKPPNGISLNQYVRGIVIAWGNDLNTQGGLATHPSVSSLKKIINDYRHSLSDDTERGIRP